MGNQLQLTVFYFESTVVTISPWCRVLYERGVHYTISKLFQVVGTKYAFLLNIGTYS